MTSGAVRKYDSARDPTSCVLGSTPHVVTREVGETSWISGKRSTGDETTGLDEKPEDDAEVKLDGQSAQLSSLGQLQQIPVKPTGDDASGYLQ